MPDQVRRDYDTVLKHPSFADVLDCMMATRRLQTMDACQDVT